MKFLTRTKTIRHALAFAMIGIFLFAATFSMAVGMQTDEHDIMSRCPFMFEQTSVCPMGVFEHIEKWQQFSTTLLLFAFVLFIIFVRALNVSSSALALSSPIQKNKPETKLFNHLVTIFSQGILNPRLYA